MAMPKLLLMIMLLIPPILITMILASKNPKIPIFIEKLQSCPNTSDDDAASPDEAASPDSLIDSKLKLKIYPRSMIKLNKLKRQ